MTWTRLRVIPDSSRSRTSRPLDELLGQAGVGSLRALAEMPLSEACQTLGLLSYDTQDWDLVGRAIEQAGLVDRPRFGWSDEEPDAGLKELAPSKRALHCLLEFRVQLG